MKKKPNTTMHIFLSAIISAILFLVLFIILKWHIVVDIVISILSYFALGYLLAPTVKIGDIAVEHLDQGERIGKIYHKAQEDVQSLIDYQGRVIDNNLWEKARNLAATGQDIIKFLTDHPESISKSEHFLDYYLNTSKRILKNYTSLQTSNVSKDKWALIQKETNDSLDFLNDIFAKQRDSYYKDTILELEVESDLLEKTVHLGGGRK